MNERMNTLLGSAFLSGVSIFVLAATPAARAETAGADAQSDALAETELLVPTLCTSHQA
jgi:hypothetical protein